MRHITLITGGSRSGKSRFALQQGEAHPGPHAFIATSPALDEEMKERIRRHREERGAHWRTVEEQTDLAGALSQNASVPVVLVDCLTLWVNNLLYHDRAGKMTEDRVAEASRALLAVAAEQTGHLLLVTNETGMGIMPGNALARRFGDCAGRCNQVMASAAEQVVLMVAGLPVFVKGGTP
ncbi:bifunctional adenosylcobinamide kinase/adenosylcobinamide-phosphate guanylyltransferase [Acanthopleuribacter pedis]|uniref:Adenosylcobinamide kinase n=1 Tax=Acanthopleuribacter pedis TaxID=442870 RepID=A0A8J7QDZ5_9BACT|nr:bifunctional adenosylcobinamide kinase/adenosylcobinamide-phosphate guanylyltransferase [Acanthopleuribacter pedis]MBO1322084.1 bifunctional adenosylcobinamide kinase/adenosylcobinamide-phosphate guanylyltransferase [Acanthopleuribacter pedis]